MSEVSIPAALAYGGGMLAEEELKILILPIHSSKWIVQQHPGYMSASAIQSFAPHRATGQIDAALEAPASPWPAGTSQMASVVPIAQFMVQQQSGHSVNQFPQITSTTYPRAYLGSEFQRQGRPRNVPGSVGSHIHAASVPSVATEMKNSSRASHSNVVLQNETYLKGSLQSQDHLSSRIPSDKETELQADHDEASKISHGQDNSNQQEKGSPLPAAKSLDAALLSPSKANIHDLGEQQEQSLQERGPSLKKRLKLRSNNKRDNKRESKIGLKEAAEGDISVESQSAETSNVQHPNIERSVRQSMFTEEEIRGRKEAWERIPTPFFPNSRKSSLVDKLKQSGNSIDNAHNRSQSTPTIIITSTLNESEGTVSSNEAKEPTSKIGSTSSLTVANVPSGSIMTTALLDQDVPTSNSGINTDKVQSDVKTGAETMSRCDSGGQNLVQELVATTSNTNTLKDDSTAEVGDSFDYKKNNTLATGTLRKKSNKKQRRLEIPDSKPHEEEAEHGG